MVYVPTGHGPPGGDLDWFMCIQDMARPVGILSGLCAYRTWPARWGFRVCYVPTGHGPPGRDLKWFLCLQERACPVGI